MTELTHLDAVTALRAFRGLELSPVELLDALIARIERANGDRQTGVNAFTETLFDEARAEAKLAESAYLRAARAQEPTAPLLGIPVAAKERHSLAGRRIEQGLAAHAGRVAEVDHPVIERIQRAGGIVHARTTTPEFSCATVTHSAMWGVTRNPWNLDATPGGSSGGAGAALAAGMTTLATASDIAGSTRVPAAFTGTVGYKAPYGRIPGLPPLSADWYRGDGPMGRTVADTALLASVMSGRHPVDHTSWGPEGVPIVLPEDPVDALRGIRIGFSPDLGAFPVEPEVEAATADVVARLEKAGAVVVPVDLPWTGEQVVRTIFAHFGQILAPAMTREAGAVTELAPYAQRFIADARRAAERDDLVNSFVLDAAMQRELAAAMAGVDVLLCPTNAVTALTADDNYLDGIDIAGHHREHYWAAHLTSPFNVANRCPVLAVPSGTASNGVPTGVQVVGHPFDEGAVFRVGAGIEALVPRKPWPDLVG
ncbi:aspartyl-tRNA(Asn)/glutamyl-tRNA(Gln) amidotransferase subunit A [Saccharopolyspora antimicrobica]|uniref:Aspartyl-tRNA(Asn)/glutamyl-tRNA(Gln) amidotransferase subunit A n=1 Tax=Saccharopolyspora antimicrobica TaxID=455193 RepID=A0A1I5CCJ6_9PSEU|nr:amidase [Saccharopolyspora antimicrobica]RKT88905.1 aspartyl-tRNA(Asn)/glutamyl-tRNA(Gln) amidotransferase subunit A [Saccharopolyspora antimicrobica]SFN84522.1 aspartyl-tRNA(Asn)/glutamyl-tRNA(Gln) amidotransferase subunit A [Saccharopolyspora antimicrobica]